jgi:peroxin-6
MYALCSDAMLKAITRQARAVDEKVAAISTSRGTPITTAYFFDHLATEEDTAVMVMEEDFIEAHKELVPSVSADELKHYEGVRMTFEGTGKKDESGRPSQNGTARPSTSYKGKGKAPASPDDGNLAIYTENIDINGSASGANAKGKGKGKASAVSHASKNSLDIAEGGFGSAADGDEELYS